MAPGGSGATGGINNSYSQRCECASVSVHVRVSQRASEQQHGQTDGTLQEIFSFFLNSNLPLFGTERGKEERSSGRKRRRRRKRGGAGLGKSTKLNTKIKDWNPNQQHEYSPHAHSLSLTHTHTLSHSHTHQDGSSVQFSLLLLLLLIWQKYKELGEELQTSQMLLMCCFQSRSQ